jgi:hypothetical protein
LSAKKTAQTIIFMLQNRVAIAMLQLLDCKTHRSTQMTREDMMKAIKINDAAIAAYRNAIAANFQLGPFATTILTDQVAALRSFERQKPAMLEFVRKC